MAQTHGFLWPQRRLVQRGRAASSVLLGAVGIVLAGTGTAPAADGPPPQYALHNGYLAGTPAEPSGVTILIDQKNGRTWMLAQRESAQWVEIPFAADEPAQASPK